MKKPLICFDLDGTLIDSTDALVKSYQIAFEKNRLKKPSKKTLIKHFGVEHSAVIKKTHPKISKRKLKKVIKDQKEAELKYRNQIKTIPGVKSTLIKLKKYFCLSVVSNNYYETICESLENAKIPTKIFDIIIGGDETKAKPSPNEIFLAEKLTKTNAKYMVGDTTYDILAGKKAHCKTIAVSTGVHSYEKLLKSNPEILVKSVSILPDILIK